MPTILLAEDSKFLRIATERVLIKAGYAVITVSEGGEVWRIAANRLPDLIVLDMLLPGMSGPEVLRALKRNVLTAHIPVVVCSSLSQKNEPKLIREGASAFVEKASLLNDSAPLVDVIRAVLNKSASVPVAQGAPGPGVETS